MNQKKGLFLGAGASYDFAFPLASHLTKEIKDWLTPDKLIWLTEQWKDQGATIREETNLITKQLLESDLNYEQLIGALEIEASRVRGNNELYQDMWGRVAWFYELVYILLKERQCKNGTYANLTLDMYSRFNEFVKTEYPFWVFTLNHDINVEIIANKYGIKYKTGFSDEIIDFPLRDTTGKVDGRIKFKSFDTEKLTKEPLNYFNNINDRGINLFKLHGALDVFLFDDAKKYLKIDFDECSDHHEMIKLIADVDEKLFCTPPFKVTNEIAFEDDSGATQFLRRSILSGVNKFKNKVGQILPEEILPLFKQHLNSVGDLYVVGYGFGDGHVNNVLRDWLAFHGERRLIIVNPGINQIPEEFKVFFNQCSLRQETFLEFLARETNCELSPEETVICNARELIRKNSGK